MSAYETRNDTLSILITNRIHSFLDDKPRALKISRCCKTIRDKTKDKVLYDACKSIIKAVQNGSYKQAVNAIELTELNYFKEYK